MGATSLDRVEQEARIAMYQADTELKIRQARNEGLKRFWQGVAAGGGLLAGGAALLALILKLSGKL